MKKNDQSPELELFPKEEPSRATEKGDHQPENPAKLPLKIRVSPPGPSPSGSPQAIKAQIRVHLEEMDEIHLQEVLHFCQHLIAQEKF